jgi:phosphoribosylamine--glycine ligase
MRILLVGSGGREHALAWKIAQSPLVRSLDVEPGNGGTEGLKLAAGGAVQNMDGGPATMDEIVLIASLGAKFWTGEVRRMTDLVVVGPEGPLADGIADQLRARGIPTFGPSRAAAQLEASKAFAKDFMQRHNIPTAEYGAFSDARAAKAFLDRFQAPYVIKADGLAAGKGVVIAASRAEAEAEIDAMLGGRFGAASRRVVIEEHMTGEEASFFALTDGTTVLPLAAAQDHKRAYDGDQGPNTGGMGAYSPTPALSDAQATEVMTRIVRPTIAGMTAEGAPFQGVLFVGLMMTAEGPKVVEYNVRFGDPECQILMMRMKSDIVPYLHAAATGTLASRPPIEWDPRPAVTVVMAAKGYPGEVQKGSVIRGVERANALPGVTVFVAGAEREGGQLVATGGRVLNVTAVGDTVAEATARAYAGVDAIDWPGGFCRRDIAQRALTGGDAS